MRLSLLLTFLLSIVTHEYAAAQTASRWVSGPALKRQLAESAGIAVTGIPLRKSIEDLGRSRQVSILLDRRVDPGQSLTLTANDVPLGEILGQIGTRHGLGMTVLGSVVYLGPPEFTAKLRTLAELRREEVRARPDVVERLLSMAAFRWPDFAAPREILERLAVESQFTIEGLTRVPHDLWAGADLAPLAWIDRLTLVAGQFDLTFAVSPQGRSLTLIPIPDNVAIVRSYPGGSQPSRLAEKWGAMFPHAQVKVVETRVYVRGSLEDHERLVASMSPGSTTKPTAHKPTDKRSPREAEKRYTLKRAEGQFDLLLSQLGERLQVEVRLDREALERAGISWRQQVSVSVTDATLDELFTAVLKPVGCTFRRRGNVIEVLPSP